MVVYPKKMLSNLNITKGLIFSQEVMLELTKSGIPREKAYKIIQKNAMQVWKTNEDFTKVLEKDPEINKLLSKKEINKLLDFKHAIRRTNYIFNKVFK